MTFCTRMRICLRKCTRLPSSRVLWEDVSPCVSWKRDSHRSGFLSSFSGEPQSGWEFLCGPLFMLTPSKATPTGFLKRCLSGLGYCKRNKEKAGKVQNPKVSLFCCLPARGGTAWAVLPQGVPQRGLRCFTGPGSPQSLSLPWVCVVLGINQ